MKKGKRVKEEDVRINPTLQDEGTPQTPTVTEKFFSTAAINIPNVLYAF